MIRSIGKQSRESVESVLKKKATGEGFEEKEGFKPGMKDGDGILIISMNVSSITTV